MNILIDPRRRPVRTILVLMAVCAIIVLTVISTSLTNGIRESSKRVLERIGADIYVLPEDLNPLLLDLMRFDQGGALIDEIENSTLKPSSLSPRLHNNLFWRSVDGDMDQITAFGIIPERESDFGQFEIIEGSWFQVGVDPVHNCYRNNGSAYEDNFTFEVLISEGFSDGSGIGVGDGIELFGSPNHDGGLSFKIGGIFRDGLSGSAESIMIHLGELQYMKGLLSKDTLTEILLSYGDDIELENVIEWSKGSDFIFRDIVDFHRSSHIVDDLERFMVILDAFSIMIIAATLAVVLFFTSTLFMMTTKERSKDIALLRALGFSRAGVIKLIVRDSFIITISGALVGFGAGLGLIELLNSLLESGYSDLPANYDLFIMNGKVIAVAFLATMMISILSGIFPSIISSRLAPMESLRRENR